MSDVDFVLLLVSAVFCLAEVVVAVPRLSGVTDQCFFWFADDVSGWWCCPTFTLSLDRVDGVPFSFVRNNSGVSIGCRLKFPELVSGADASSESAGGKVYPWFAIVAGLAFGILFIVCLWAVIRVVRLLCDRIRPAPAVGYVRAASPQLGVNLAPLVGCEIHPSHFDGLGNMVEERQIARDRRQREAGVRPGVTFSSVTEIVPVHSGREPQPNLDVSTIESARSGEYVVTFL